MGDCEKAHLLGAYHDGELPPDACRELERHLAGCSQCAAELQRIGELTRMLSCLGQVRIPAETLGRLHRAADALPTVAVRRMAGVLSSVAAIVLTVCTAGLSIQDSSASPSAMPFWETQVLSQQAEAADSGSSEELLVGWMAQDLAMRDEP